VPSILLVVKPYGQRLRITFGGKALGAIEEVWGHIFEGEAASKVLFEVFGVDPVKDHKAETHAVAAFDDEEGAFDLLNGWEDGTKGVNA
jgi:hypothetical protein